MVCVAVAAGSVLSCAGSNVAAGMSSGPGTAAESVSAGTTISVVDVLAELDGLKPPAGVDPALHTQLVEALRRGIASSASGRITVAVPGSAGSRVDDLRIWDNGDGTATSRFSYHHEGDYNQDSQVTASDITPLGQYYDRQTGAADWVRAGLADGNSDGRVAVSDITPIGQQYGNSIDGYILESTATPLVDDSWQERGRLLFETSKVPAVGGRRQFVHELADPVIGASYRIVPFLADTTGVAGSEVAYTGEPAPSFTVSGVCLDGASVPLEGVQLTLGSAAPAVSGADGTFTFTGLADGFSAELVPSRTGLLFLPASYAVTINNDSFTGIQFIGHVVTGINSTLPDVAEIGQDITLVLEVVDGAGQPVEGFNAAATLASDQPGLLVQTPPVFADGSATATVCFLAGGTHTIFLSGLHAELDGPLGSVSVESLVPPVLAAAKWQGNAEAAISLTFDDGTEDHWLRGLPLWEEYGFRVTLGIILRNVADKPGSIAQLQEAFDAGHEIANHSATHPELTSLTPLQIEEELSSCAEFLVSNVNGLERIDTVIYPYELFDDTVLDIVESQGYLFARSGYQGISDHAELNDAWSPPFLHLYSWANQDVLPLAMWDSTTDWTLNHGDWLVEQCHGIGTLGETGVGWSPRPEAEFRAHYDHLASFGDRLWIAPVREVGCYVVERNSAQFDVLEYTATHLDFILYDSLDNNVFNVPLTVLLELPAGWPGATVSQGATNLPATILDGQVMFDVKPGSGSVRVKRAG